MVFDYAIGQVLDWNGEKMKVDSNTEKTYLVATKCESDKEVKREGAQVFASPKLWVLSWMAKNDGSSIQNYFRIPKILGNVKSDKNNFAMWLALLSRYNPEVALNEDGTSTFKYHVSKSIAMSYFEMTICEDLNAETRKVPAKNYQKFIDTAKKTTGITIIPLGNNNQLIEITADNYDWINKELFLRVVKKSYELNDFRYVERNISVFYAISTIARVQPMASNWLNGQIKTKSSVCWATLETVGNIIGLDSETCRDAYAFLIQNQIIATVLISKYGQNYRKGIYYVTDIFHEQEIERELNKYFSDGQYKYLEVANSFGWATSKDYLAKRDKEKYVKFIPDKNSEEFKYVWKKISKSIKNQG